MPINALDLTMPEEGSILAEEFEQLVERYQPALMRLAYGMAGDRLVADP